MALRQCPDCAAQVSDQALACPRCGKPMQDALQAQASGQMQRTLVAVIILGGIMFACYWTMCGRFLN